MKVLVKIFRLSFFLVFIFAVFTIQARAHIVPAANEVSFGLRFEDMTTQTGQIRRVYFTIQKDPNALPVSLSTAIRFVPNLFQPLQNTDVVTPSVLTNKVVYTSIDPNNPGIIKVSLKGEGVNEEPLPSGDLFYIDFKVLTGVDLDANSIDFNYDSNLGPHQASTKDATLLKVVNEWGTAFDYESVAGNGAEESGARFQSCFIGALYLPGN